MFAELLHRARAAASVARPSAFAAKPFRCPACGPSLLIRLSRDALGVRCLRCAASAATLSLIAVLNELQPRLGAVYELSARGPLVAFLGCKVAALTCSEYLDGVPPGEARDGVLCQDVQALTFPDASFDVCTSTEVMEHVADDRAAFRELYRVLRPGGLLVFTVPLGRRPTVERARMEDGRLVHLLPPEYHGDRLRGAGKVLAFRNYGPDIVERLLAAGFQAAAIHDGYARTFFGQGVPVVVAHR